MLVFLHLFLGKETFVCKVIEWLWHFKNYRAIKTILSLLPNQLFFQMYPKLLSLTQRLSTSAVSSERRPEFRHIHTWHDLLLQLESNESCLNLKALWRVKGQVWQVYCEVFPGLSCTRLPGFMALLTYSGPVFLNRWYWTAH